LCCVGARAALSLGLPVDRPPSTSRTARSWAVLRAIVLFRGPCAAYCCDGGSPRVPAIVRCDEWRRGMASSDTEQLHQLGYAQELRRGMRTFSNFAVSFTIISILSGCLTLFAYGMNTGGPAVMTLGWLVVGFFVTLCALGMAEVASSYPTAGGLYYWSAKLAKSNGPAWSWFTGWFNLLGQVAVTAGI